jgi:membrane protein
MKVLRSRGLEFLEVSKGSVRSFLEHDMPTYAAALAYRALFALFPFFAFLMALLGFLEITSVFEWMIDQTRSTLQEQYARTGEWLIRQGLYQAQGGELLSSIIVLAIWSVSGGVRSLTKALNTVHGVVESRPAWKRLVLQAFFAVCLAVTLIIAISLLLIGPWAVEWLVGLVGLDEIFISLWAWLRLPVALVLLMLVVSVVYWVVPNVDQPLRLITPGAVLAVIVWVVASLAFAYYVSNFANYSVIYGSLGAAVALLLYFYISAVVLLLGAEMNAVIHFNVSKKDATEEDE